VQIARKDKVAPAAGSVSIDSHRPRVSAKRGYGDGSTEDRLIDNRDGSDQ
jgi:hypothetical protein